MISEVGFIKKEKYDKTYMHSNDFTANFDSRELIIETINKAVFSYRLCLNLIYIGNASVFLSSAYRFSQYFITIHIGFSNFLHKLYIFWWWVRKKTDMKPENFRIFSFKEGYPSSNLMDWHFRITNRTK